MTRPGRTLADLLGGGGTAKTVALDIREPPDVEAALRGIAVMAGENPDLVVRDFKRGGALARILGRIAGAASPKKGRPRAIDARWLEFVVVSVAMRNAAPGEDPFVIAGGQLKPDDPDQTEPDRLRASYRRSQKKGWKTEDVPEGLSALFEPAPADKM